MLVQDAMQAPVITAAPEEPLAEAALRMETARVRRLPVVQGGRLVGLVTGDDLDRHLPTWEEPTREGGLSPWVFAARASRVRVRDAMRGPVRTAAPGDPLARAVGTLLRHRVGALPVVEGDAVEGGGRVVGMLTATDVLRAQARRPPPAWGDVRRHMTGTTVSVQAGAPAGEAASVLELTGLRVLPVLEGEHLVGVLLGRDLNAAGRAGLRAGPTPSGPLAGQTARDLMRAPGGYVLGGAPLHSAVTAMLDAAVHGLPVVGEDGRLLGVVTITDVLRAFLREHAAEGDTDRAAPRS